MRDSALVEKRGPSMVTTVPRSMAAIPEFSQPLIQCGAQRGIKRIRHGTMYGIPGRETLMKGHPALFGEINELIRTTRSPRIDVLSQRANRRAGQNAGTSGISESMNGLAR